MCNWNEMSYNRYKNRKSEEYNYNDEYKYLKEINDLYDNYEDYYKENTFSVEDLFYLDYEE